MRSALQLAVGLIMLVGLAGCSGDSYEGPEMADVTGTVTLDGETVEGAHVSFSPRTKGIAGFAVTDKRGRFRLGNSLTPEGAIPGMYDITVVKEVREGGMEFDSEEELNAYIQKHGEGPPQSTIVNKLPARYANKETSGLSQEVSMAKKNHFDLKLTLE